MSTIMQIICFLVFIYATYCYGFEENLSKAGASRKSAEIEEEKIIKAVYDSIAEWKSKSLRHRRKRADKIVCYGDLGCFEDSGPFGYIDMLPSSPEEINTKFLVYSTKNRSESPFLEFYFHDIAPNSLFLNDTSNATFTEKPEVKLKDEKGRSKADTETVNDNIALIYNKFGDLQNSSFRVIVHGFGSSCHHVWIHEMRTALMAVEDDCVVMCVDWENGASLPNYVKAAANTRLVGKQLSYLLKALKKNNGLDFLRIHLIGFSLGAHVSGFTGTDIRLHRITGLDPAGPLFESQHPNARLDETDADFVDVIHSNGENLILGGLGSWQPMGDVDFYPNGGRVQHGCSNLFVGAVTDIIWAPTSVEGRSLCNHRRAYKFFIDSVAKRCLFPAFPCDSYENFLEGKCFSCKLNISSKCGNMGYYADKSTGKGQLYLKTREEEPFCAHQYKLQIHSSYNDLPLRTLGKVEVILESESGLTETFTVTEKDDQEIFAGQFISKILVPHPALNFPKNVTVNYYVYRGWISRGLPKWGINKIILSNSFGESFSLCKEFTLQSGIGIRMELFPGDCSIEEEEDDYTIIKLPENITEKPVTTQRTTEEPKRTEKPIIPIIGSRNKSTEIVELGKHTIISNETKIYTSEPVNEISTTDSWQPITRNMILKVMNDNLKKSSEVEDVVDDSLSLNFGDRIPKNTKTEKRSFTQIERQASTEFRLLTTELSTTTSTTTELITTTTENTVETSDMNKLITVQLFPYRLANVFERAEKYAKSTLFPFISDSFSSLFKVNAAESENKTDFITQKSLNSQKEAQIKFEIKESPKVAKKLNEIARFEKSNEKSSEETLDVEKKPEEMAKIHIDLPTYSPETTTKATARKRFIPLLQTD